MRFDGNVEHANEHRYQDSSDQDSGDPAARPPQAERPRPAAPPFGSRTSCFFAISHQRQLSRAACKSLMPRPMSDVMDGCRPLPRNHKACRTDDHAECCADGRATCCRSGLARSLTGCSITTLSTPLSSKSPTRPRTYVSTCGGRSSAKSAGSLPIFADLETSCSVGVGTGVVDKAVSCARANRTPPVCARLSPLAWGQTTPQARIPTPAARSCCAKGPQPPPTCRAALFRPPCRRKER